jgi:amino acid transporter
MAAIQQRELEGQQSVIDAQERELLPSEGIMAAGYLPRILTTTDLSIIFIAVILFIANAAVVPGAGAAAFIYWILGFATFLIPCAIATAELGRAFPGEGSIYLWSTKTLGPFWGFFSGFCHWFPGVLVLVSTSDVVVTIVQSMGPTNSSGMSLWLTEPWQQGLVILGVLVFSFICATLPLRRIQTLVNLVVGSYLVAILLVGAAGLVLIMNGHLPQQDFTSGSWQLTSNNLPIYGTVILALLGVELPLTMGAEIRQQRSITRHLVWGAAGVMAAYLIGTFGFMMVVPGSNIGNPAAISLAVSIVFGKGVGTLVSVIIILFFVFNTALYNYLFARMMMVTSLDRRLPAKIAQLNRFQQPWVAALYQTLIAALFTFVAFILVPYVIQAGQTASTLSSEVYNVFQAAVTVVWCIAMFFLFITAPLARRKLRAQGRMEATQTAPWLIGACAVIGVLASLFGIWTTLNGSWIPNIITSDRWWYIVVVACFAGLDIGLLLTFFLTGRPVVDPIRAREPRAPSPASAVRKLPAAPSAYQAEPRPQPSYTPSQPMFMPSQPMRHLPSQSGQRSSQPFYPPQSGRFPPRTGSRDNHS